MIRHTGPEGGCCLCGKSDS